MSTTIRKVLYPSFGDSSIVSIINEPISPPSKKEVQVDIVYSGFSGADVNMRMGNYPMQKKAPLVPGYCFAGRVSAHGQGAESRFKIGDLVAAITVYDSHAEKINIPEKYLIAVPQGISLQAACALVLDWNTAYGMVTRGGKVKAGQKVFIHGLSGAVGHASMKIAQLQGATVYGTASERNHAQLREEGAHPFVYTDKNWMTAMQELGGADAVFDPLGPESWEESWEITKKGGGTLVGFGSNKSTLEGSDSGVPGGHLPNMLKLLSKNVTGLVCWRGSVFYYIDRDQSTYVPEAEKVFELASQGKIEVPIRRIWDMEDIRQAHDSWGKVPGVGSLLIRVGKE